MVGLYESVDKLNPAAWLRPVSQSTISPSPYVHCEPEFLSINHPS